MSAEQEVLERVREYRLATRMIVQATHVDPKRRELGLIDLAEMARAEVDLTTRTWSERAIWEEAKAFLGVDDEQLALPPEPYEVRHRRLRAAGLAQCPTCLGTIASEAELGRWSDMRRAEAERLEAHQRAVT